MGCMLCCISFVITSWVVDVVIVSKVHGRTRAHMVILYVRLGVAMVSKQYFLLRLLKKYAWGRYCYSMFRAPQPLTPTCACKYAS